MPPWSPSSLSSPLSPAAALLALHVAVVLFGFAGLFGKWIAWTPAAIVLGRTVVAAAGLAVFILWRQRALPRPTGFMAGNGVLLAVHWIAFFAAIQASTVAVGLLGYASFPLFVPLLERLLLRQHPPRRAWLQAALVVCGLLLLVPDFHWRGAHTLGLAWGILSGVTFAWMTVRMRHASPSVPADALAFWQNAIAALCVLPIVVGQGGVGGATTLVTMLQVAVLGLICTALAHTLYIGSLARVSANTAAVVAALEPVYGMVLALWLLGEVPQARTWAGAVLIVAAAVVESRSARRAPVP